MCIDYYSHVYTFIIFVQQIIPNISNDISQVNLWDTWYIIGYIKKHIRKNDTTKIMLLF
jgi:hypothetical protein